MNFNVTPFATRAGSTLPAPAAPPTMTSREIASLTGKEHKHVMRDIRVMVEALGLDESNFGHIYLDAYNRQQSEYALDEELSITLVSGYDVKMRLAIIRRWKELEGKAPAPLRVLTNAEMFVQAGQVMLQIETRCAAIEQTQLSIAARLDDVEESSVWKVCPTAAESIMHIRARINSKYGLSAAIVDEVMRQSVHAPKPAGMVLNRNECAGKSHYAVYWKKDVTKVFEVFMKETVQETTSRFSHPLIVGKFKVAA